MSNPNSDEPEPFSRQLLNIDLQGKSKEDLTEEELADLRELAGFLEDSEEDWNLTPGTEEALKMARSPTERPMWISGDLWDLLGQVPGARRWVMAEACKEGTAGAYQPVRHVLREHAPGRWEVVWNDQEDMWDVEPEPYLEDSPDKIWKIPLPASDRQWRTAVELLRQHPQTKELSAPNSGYALQPEKPDLWSLLVVLLTAKWKLHDPENRKRLGELAAKWGVKRNQAKLQLIDLGLRATLASVDELTRIRIGSGEGSFYLRQNTVEIRKTEDGRHYVTRGQTTHIPPSSLSSEAQFPYLGQEALRQAKEWLPRLTAESEDLRPKEEVRWPTDPETGEPLEVPDPDAPLPDDALLGEENERTVEFDEVLEVASPQQREIVLAKAGPFFSTQVGDDVKASLTAEEQDLLNLECESWADVARALDLPPGQVRQQKKRLQQKLA